MNFSSWFSKKKDDFQKKRWFTKRIIFKKGWFLKKDDLQKDAF